MHAAVFPSQLTGGKCTMCKQVAYPRRMACRRCGAAPLEEVQLSGRAQLQAWTTVRVPPSGFDAPYVLGYARMNEGPRMLVRIEGSAADLEIGTVLALRRSRDPAVGVAEGESLVANVLAPESASDNA